MYRRYIRQKPNLISGVLFQVVDYRNNMITVSRESQQIIWIVEVANGFAKLIDDGLRNFLVGQHIEWIVIRKSEPMTVVDG